MGRKTDAPIVFGYGHPNETIAFGRRWGASLIKRSGRGGSIRYGWCGWDGLAGLLAYGGGRKMRPYNIE